MADDSRVGVTAPPLLLSVRSLSFQYPVRSIMGESRGAVGGLQDVSLDVCSGKTVAVVGPSGSGKSTLARCMVLLEKPNSGKILYNGTDLLTLDRPEQRKTLRELHLIFQDSATALNPRFSVAEAITEPLQIHNMGGSQDDSRALLTELMDQVRLSPKWLEKNTRELSGGQRQRVALARALALRPKILILDEPLSSLDASTQAVIANLLTDLQERFALTYVLITHDLAMAAHFSDEVAVMRQGQVVQRGTPKDVFTSNRFRPGKLLPSLEAPGDTRCVTLIPAGE